jgi:hypothetical protein
LAVFRRVKSFFLPSGSSIDGTLRTTASLGSIAVGWASSTVVNVGGGGGEAEGLAIGGGGGDGEEALGAEMLATWFIFVETKGLVTAGGDDTILNLDELGLSDPFDTLSMFFRQFFTPDDKYNVRNL